MIIPPGERARRQRNRCFSVEFLCELSVNSAMDPDFDSMAIAEIDKAHIGKHQPLKAG
jgi:hypothetical protein